MVLNRKGIFFSIISVLLSTFIILIFSSMLADTLDREAQVSSIKVRNINDIVQDLDLYAGAALDSSTFFSLEALIQNHVEEGAFSSSRYQLEQCLLNNSFVGRSLTNCADAKAGYGLSLRNNVSGRQGVLNEIEDLYPGLNTSYTLYNVSVDQTDAYIIQVNATVNIRIISKEAVWDRYMLISRNISLVGVRDPYWSNSTFSRTIRWKPDASGFQFQASSLRNNYSFFNNFSKGGYVFRDPSAASFFSVLDGDLPTTVDPSFDSNGYSSIVPAYLDGVSMYEDNQTSFITHYNNAVTQVTFTPSQLRRINSSLLNTNQTFPLDYLQLVSVTDTTGPEIYDVAACCDNNGCNPACS